MSQETNNMPIIHDIDGHIKSVLIIYPSVTKNKMDFLLHLFCTIGNGYEWTKDGGMEYCDSRFPMSIEDSLKMFVMQQINFLRDGFNMHLNLPESLREIVDPVNRSIERQKQATNESFDYENRFNDMSISPMIEERKKWDERKTHPTEPHLIYPISQYSRIITMPNNVQEQWLELAADFVESLNNQTELLFPKDLEYLDQINESFKRFE